MDNKKKRRTNQLNVRIDEELRKQFDAACDATDEDPANVIKTCIDAFIKAVERDGEITKPYVIVGKKRLAELAKDSTQYSPSPPGKVPASGGRRTSGRTDVEAAIAENRVSASTPLLPPNLNEDAPQELAPKGAARGNITIPKPQHPHRAVFTATSNTPLT